MGPREEPFGCVESVLLMTMLMNALVYAVARFITVYAIATEFPT